MNNDKLSITFENENMEKWCNLNNIDYGSDFYTPIPQDINSYVKYSEIYKDVNSSLGEIKHD